MKQSLGIGLAVLVIASGCQAHRQAGSGAPATVAPQWEEVELVFESERSYENPYTHVLMYVVFRGPGGELRRPAFWDGGNTWRVRFASPTADGVWRWRSYNSDESDRGLHGRTGRIRAVRYAGDNPLIRRGLLRMSPGARNLVHADGTPFLLVGDTPWALPWRATLQTATIFARDRQAKGFNAALLMSVMPDMDARGPRDRTQIGGFDVGFEDLKDGHLNQLNPEYFQYMDQLVSILVDHGIVPVYNPVFQGYGWKGQRSLGSRAVPEEYVRYTRYLVARYGARPAMWLVSADGDGRHPPIYPAGREVKAWDTYRQPTGIHYSPHDDWVSEGRLRREPDYQFHYNRSHHSAKWLHFQWPQTGHNGEHLPHKVSRAHDYIPTKATANGEPTYERMGSPDNAVGWWQGHEAWLNITSGGTMGHVYGAGGLWNWKLAPDEGVWSDWADTRASWREALDFEGSRYIGYVSRAFQGLDFLDITKHPELAGGHLAVAKPGELYVVYLPEGGEVPLGGLVDPLPYRWFNPREGSWADDGTVSSASPIVRSPDGGPWVLIVGRHRGEISPS